MSFAAANEVRLNEICSTNGYYALLSSSTQHIVVYCTLYNHNILWFAVDMALVLC